MGKKHVKGEKRCFTYLSTLSNQSSSYLLKVSPAGRCLLNPAIRMNYYKSEDYYVNKSAKLGNPIIHSVKH